MRRLMPACAALLLGATAASAAQPLRFEVRRQTASTAELRIERPGSRRRANSWSQTVRLQDLPGLDPASLDRNGRVAFRVLRSAGTLDCRGSAHDRHAGGDCTLIADAGFVDGLAARGIGRPDADEIFQLTMAGVSLDVADAATEEGWARPTLRQLVELGIFHVTAAGTHDLARAGYRGGAIQTMIEFAIFQVTPDFIARMRAAGLDRPSARTLVELRVFAIKPAEVRVFARDGKAPAAAQSVGHGMAGIVPARRHGRD